MKNKFRKLIIILLLGFCLLPYALSDDYVPYNYGINVEGIQVDGGQKITAISTDDTLDSGTATDSQLLTANAITTMFESAINALSSVYQTIITGAATTITDADLTPDKMLGSNSSGKVEATGINSADVLSTDNVKTVISKSIDADSNTITNIGDDELKTGINANKIADGSVSNSAFQNIYDLTGPAQSQIDGKQATVTGAASTVTTTDLNTSRTIISNALGKIETLDTVDTQEIEYLNGVNDYIQNQIDAINSSLLGLTATDIDADTTNFNNNLSASDTTVQTALETLDDISLVSTADTADTSAVVVYNGGLAVYKLLKGTGASDGDVVTFNGTSGEFEIRANPGAGGGEANTASNVGTGLGFFKQKNGVDLEFYPAKNTDGYLTLSRSVDDNLFNLASTTGSDSDLVTGTAGSDNQYGYWLNGSLKGGQPIGTSSGNLVGRSGDNSIATDTISEVTGDNGVSVDSLNIKDGGIYQYNLSVGDGTDTDIYYYFNNGDANLPAIKYDSATNALQYSNDGTIYTAIDSGGGSTAVGQYSLSADQTTNLTAGNEIEFNAEDVDANAQFSFNTTTHQATLVSGNRYTITFSVYSDFSSAGGYLYVNLYNTSQTENIYPRIVVLPVNYTSTEVSNSTVTVSFTPDSDDVIELRITGSGNISNIDYTRTSMTITEYQN